MSNSSPSWDTMVDTEALHSVSEDARHLAMRVLLAINPALGTVDKLNEAVLRLGAAERERDEARTKLAEVEADRAAAQRAVVRLGGELEAAEIELGHVRAALLVAARNRDEAKAREQRMASEISQYGDIVGARPVDARRRGETIAEAAQRVVAERDEARAALLKLDADGLIAHATAPPPSAARHDDTHLVAARAELELARDAFNRAFDADVAMGNARRLAQKTYSDARARLDAAEGRLSELTTKMIRAAEIAKLEAKTP